MIEKPIVADALLSLSPNAQFVVDDGNVLWYSPDIPQPSEEEINTELARLQAEYDSKAYARARATAYPSVADFMEAYTEKEIGGDSTKWDAYVTAYNKVRTDNPKP